MRAQGPCHPDLREPLALLCLAPPGTSGASELRFEFSSRGDRVPGRLWRHAADASLRPLVLIAHDLGGSAEAPAGELASGWLERGLAVAAIDLPLHGARANRKWSELLADAEAAPAGLREEFERQAVFDLRRAMQALSGLPGVDAGRLGLAGFGLGAALGRRAFETDERPRCLALVGLEDPGETAAASADSGSELAGRPALRVHPARAAEAVAAFLLEHL